MRVITVRQPWAWAIIHGGKDVENRTRNIAGDYRGPVAIHAGLASNAIDYRTYSRLAEAGMRADELDRGAIIGVVDLIGVHRGLAPTDDRMSTVESCFRAGKPYGACSTWAEPHTWHLELANPRPLAKPIPFKGAHGMRELDTAILSEVLS